MKAVAVRRLILITELWLCILSSVWPCFAQAIPKPRQPGEVTVVLENGAKFRGMVAFETDEIIRIAMEGAELTWEKGQVKEVVRYTPPPTLPDEPTKGGDSPIEARAKAAPQGVVEGGGERAHTETTEDKEEPYSDFRMYLTPHGYAPPESTFVKSGTVRVSVDGVKDAGYYHYTPRDLAKGIMENSPYKVVEAGAGSVDATLHVTITGKPLAAVYHNLGRQYTGAKIEGTVTFTCPNGSASARFEGKVSPASTIGYSGKPVKADPKFAPYGEAFENSNCMEALADAVSRGCGVNKAKLISGFFSWSDQSHAHRQAVALARKMGREAVPGLLEAIGEKCAGLDAYKVIESVGSSAVPELAAALSHPNKYVRRVASYFLVIEHADESRQYFPAIADLMLACISEKDLDSQLFAIRMLARLGPEGGKGAARIAEFVADGRTEVHLTVLTAMKKMGPHARDAVPVLRGILMTNKDFSSRSHSAEALGYIGRTEKEARDVLAAALFHQDRFVQADAAEALGNIGAVAADAVPVLARLVESKSNADINDAPRAAIHALGKIGKTDEKARAVLAEALKSNNRVIRDEAGRALRDLGTPSKETSDAMGHALTDSRPEVRKDAAETLARMGAKAKESVPTLIDALKDQDKRVREAAIKALRDIGPEAKDAVPALIALLPENSLVGMYVTSALASIAPEDSDVQDALIRALSSHPKDTVRKYAAEALGKSGPDAKHVGDALASALDDREDGVTVEAAKALGRIGPSAKSAVPALIRALKNQNSGTRWCAAEALGDIGPAAIEALPALREAAKNDTRDRVRENAKKAIERIEKR